MGWIQELSKTYDNCQKEVGWNAERPMLLPHSHLTVQAQIEIVLDLIGNFLRARRLEKSESLTMIPVTEDSATRSSDIAPMPLCDKLCYIAGDFDKLCKPDKSKAEYYANYMEKLWNWASQGDSPKEVKAIHTYLSKGNVIKDLMEQQVYESPDDFVRFVIQGIDGLVVGVWENQEIVNSFSSYYLGTIKEKGLCFASGEPTAITEKLPAKIRNAGDKAKLISSNDKKGYTFRGRFKTANEAVGVGYLTAQKAHNALRWLIAKQGYRNESESIVCWSTGGDEVLQFLKDPDDIFALGEEEMAADTGENYARRVNLSLKGYRQNIGSHDRIIVMGVDTADGSMQGRLSITYYSEMIGSDFYQNIQSWFESCYWTQTKSNKAEDKKSKDKKVVEYVGTPSPYEIAQAAFGVDKGGKLDVDKGTKKTCIKRLLPCIAERKRFPKDIMLSAVRNAGNPCRYSFWNWNKIMQNACALIRKCQIDYGKEVYEMALNEQSTDRDYLFGRLLAVANQIEVLEYMKDKNDRKTNAMKYWSTFTRKPARTWAVVYERLLPYISKLNPFQKIKLTKLLEEILGKLEEVGGFDNEPLKENYLLGYYSQNSAFRKKESINEEEEE